jgi:Na+-transporting NADH:ubiquinone oxidoreductase subunit NqrD
MKKVLVGLLAGLGIALAIIAMLLLEIGIASGIAYLVLVTINFFVDLVGSGKLIQDDVFHIFWAVATFVIFIANRLVRR